MVRNEMWENLRLARKSDCEKLFCWANDKEVRSASFQTEPIAWETHVEWFRKMMGAENVVQFIYEWEDKPAGQVRLNIESGCGRISYSIAPEFRGQGLAKRMISMLEEKVREDYPAIHTLRAEVKGRNTVSRHVFGALDFQESEIIYTKMLRE